MMYFQDQSEKVCGLVLLKRLEFLSHLQIVIPHIPFELKRDSYPLFSNRFTLMQCFLSFLLGKVQNMSICMEGSDAFFDSGTRESLSEFQVIVN